MLCFFLDYYLSTDPKTFSPPEPFTESEFEDRMPDRVYNKDELLTYLAFCRNKCRDLIDVLTEESATGNWINMSQTMGVSNNRNFDVQHAACAAPYRSAEFAAATRNQQCAGFWIYRAGETNH